MRMAACELPSSPRRPRPHLTSPGVSHHKTPGHSTTTTLPRPCVGPAERERCQGPRGGSRGPWHGARAPTAAYRRDRGPCWWGVAGGGGAVVASRQHREQREGRPPRGPPHRSRSAGPTQGLGKVVVVL